MRLALLGLSSLLVACGSVTESGGDAGGDDDAPAVFESGDRLHAVYLDGGGGAVRLQHWRDTQLGIDCHFRDDGAGTARCLPLADVQPLYLDAGCTDPVFEVNTCLGATPPPFVSVTLPHTCVGFAPKQPHEVDVSAPLARTQVYGRDELGACVTIELGEERNLYRISPAAVDRFAAGTERRVDLDGNLGVVVLETEDGASELHGMVNTALDAECRLAGLGAEGVAYHCLHGDFAYDFDRYHSDATCGAGDVAYSVGLDGCDPPAVALVYDRVDRGDGCFVYQGSLAGIEGETPASNVYEGDDTSCQPADGSRQRYWTIGDPIENDLPALYERYVGDGQLQARHLATAGGAIARADFSGWRDQQAGASCEVWHTTSGIRCLPRTGQTTMIEHFADDACTAPLVGVGDSPCGTTGPLVLLAFNRGDVCQTVINDPRAVGAEHTGAVFRASKDGCVPHQPDMRRFFVVGAAGSASFTEYPEIVQRTGPSSP